MSPTAIVAIIAVAAVIVALSVGRKKRPKNDPFAQQAYDLLAGSAFYDIMIRRLNKLFEDEEKRSLAASEFGIDLAKARDTLFHAAFFHFNVLQYGITQDDMRQDIEKYIYPNFLGRLQSGEMDARMSLAVMPFKYAAWIKKIEAVPTEYLDVKNLLPHPEELKKAKTFLQQNLSHPNQQEINFMLDTIPIDHKEVLRYFEYWERFGYPDR